MLFENEMTRQKKSWDVCNMITGTKISDTHRICSTSGACMGSDEDCVRNFHEFEDMS